MSTAIDSNVLIALWNEDDTLNTHTRSALDNALARGRLVVAAPVYAELLASPSRSEAFLDSFCKETGVAVDWNLNEATWRAAARAFQQYVARRRKQRDSGEELAEYERQESELNQNKRRKSLGNLGDPNR
jgi:hypothetical protein